MAFDYGFDFRDTAGYVTDPANCSPVLGEIYPHTYANGATAGFTAVQVTRDRSAALDPRIAGVNAFNVTTTDYFRVDITGTAVDVHLGLGDPTNGNPADFVLKDGTSTLVTYSGFVSFGNVKDALSNTYTSANWPSSEAPTSQNFSSHLRLQSGSNSVNCVAHLRVILAAAGGVFIPLIGRGPGLALAGHSGLVG